MLKIKQIKGIITPCVYLFVGHVPNKASVIFTLLWMKGHMLGKVELPAWLKGQVSLLGPRDLNAISQEADGDVRRVETTDMADQGVRFTQFTRIVAVHLHLGWRWVETDRKRKGIF